MDLCARLPCIALLLLGGCSKEMKLPAPELQVVARAEDATILGEPRLLTVPGEQSLWGAPLESRTGAFLAIGATEYIRTAPTATAMDLNSVAVWDARTAELLARLE